MASPQVTSERRGRRAWLKFALLALLLVAVVLLEQFTDWAAVDQLRLRVEEAGALGALVFVGGYAALCLLPAPKAVLTVLGGLLYGLWLGTLLSWVAALMGAAAAFGLGRALGREAVNRLIRGRLERVDRILSSHGFGAVVGVRLVPVLPFTVINYAAGLTGVRFIHYILGTAVGMVPGSLAYAALGAWGTDPFGLFAALAALVVLALIGGLVTRRLLGNDRRDEADRQQEEADRQQRAADRQQSEPRTTEGEA